MRPEIKILAITLVSVFFWGLFELEAEEQPTFKVSGYVIDRETGEAIPGAKVLLWKVKDRRERYETVTDQNGEYHLFLPKGRYSPTAKHPDYNRRGPTCSVEAGDGWAVNRRNIYLFYQRKDIKVELPPLSELLNSRRAPFENPSSAQPVNHENGPVRIAIFKSFQSSKSASINRLLDAYIDLFSTELSGEQGLEIVERDAVDTILAELTVGLANEQPGQMALKAGRLVNARLAITNTIVQSENISALVVRIMDTAEGMIREIFTIPLKQDRLEESVKQAAGMISRLKDKSRRFENRPIVAIGSFEDESLNNRYVGLDEELRTHLQQHYLSQLPIVERVLVPPLLMELEMGQGGLTEATVDQRPPQTAVILIDGVYKTFRRETDMISLTLRAHQIGGPVYYATLELPPGESLKAGAAHVTDLLLEKIATSPPVLNSRKKEALVHIERGRKILGMEDGDSSFYLNFRRDASHKSNDFNQAISSFESASLLMPEWDIPRFNLGLCYANPIIRDYDRGFNYLYELLMTTSDKRLKLRIARFFSDKISSKELSGNVIVQKAVRDLASYLTTEQKLESTWKRSIYQSAVKGFISEEAYRQYNIDYYREYMNRILEKCQYGFHSKLINLIEDFCSLQKGIIGGTKERDLNKFDRIERRLKEEYFKRMTDVVAEKYPRLMPYFTAGYIYERSRYVNHENDPINTKLQELVQHVSEHKDHVADYDAFCMGPLSYCFSWAKQCDYYETAAQIGEMLLECSQMPDIVGIANCYCRLDDYKNALRLLKQEGNLEKRVVGCLRGLGARNIFEAIKICEAELGGGRNSVDTFELPVPLLTSQDIVSFDFYEDECWLSIGTRIATYDYRKNKLRTKAMLTDSRRAIRFLAAGRDNVYVSNKLKGLYIFNKQSGDINLVRQEDGLPLERITAFYYTPDRLWMGFSGGREAGGDIGYWDIANDNYAGLSAKRQDITGAYRSSLDRPADPPNRPVVGISQSPPENLWAAVLGKGLQQYDLATDKWRTWTNSERIVSHYDKTTHKKSRKTVYTSILDHENMASCVAANDTYVAVGCARTNNGPQPGQVLGGLAIYQYNHEQDEIKASKSLSIGPGVSPRKNSSGMSSGAAASRKMSSTLSLGSKAAGARPAPRALLDMTSPGNVSGGSVLDVGYTPESSPKEWIKPKSHLEKYWTRVGSQEGLPDVDVFSLAFSPENELWVGGRNFIAVVDLDTKKITRICNLENRAIRKIQIVNNELWILAFKTGDVVCLGGYGTNGSELYRIPL